VTDTDALAPQEKEPELRRKTGEQMAGPARLRALRSVLAHVDVVLMEAIGRAGLTISVCCGPCGDVPFRWTVQVLSRDGREFDRPFAADSFTHAIMIATAEITKRGWA
jgi:hypothetical protein